MAGNVYGHNTAASIDYAVAHLKVQSQHSALTTRPTLLRVKVKLIVILGHEGCGAIKAATLPDELINKEEGHLRDMLLEVKKGLSQHGSLGRIRDTRAKDREAVVTNVFNQMAKLGTNELITDLVSKGELLVVGAFYEISSGQVPAAAELTEPSSVLLCLHADCRSVLPNSLRFRLLSTAWHASAAPHPLLCLPLAWLLQLHFLAWAGCCCG